MGRIKIIQSESNTIFKDLKKLLGGRGVKKQGKTLVCGARLLAEAIRKEPQNCLAWISNGDRTPPPQDAAENVAWYQLAPELFGALDVFKTKSPMGLYTFSAPGLWEPQSAGLPGCSLLIPFQDPENVGAVIRSAVALDVDRVVLLAESANPFHPKSVRASAGTVFSAKLYDGPSLSDLPQDLTTISLSAKGQPLEQEDFPESFCLLAGMEGPGLPPEMQSRTIAIPMNPAVESLNAAVATSIALYEWRRRKKAI